MQQAAVTFSDLANALAHPTKLRRPYGATCPRCGPQENRFIKTGRLWFCEGRQKQSTIKVGTIFEDPALGIGKRVTAYRMLLNCKNGVSSYEVAKAVGVTQKTAWPMLHRLRLATQDTPPRRRQDRRSRLPRGGGRNLYRQGAQEHAHPQAQG
ncbi:MAG: transposase [Terriglobales bacterium]